MNTKNKNVSFRVKTTVAITLFSVFILIFLYLFQTFYLNYYYEIYKIDQVEDIAKDINKGVDNLNDYLVKISRENDICILVVTSSGTVPYNQDLKGCILKNPSTKTTALMERMYEGEEKSLFFKITNPLYNTKSFLYGLRLNDGYIFLNSQLESLDDTNKVLKKQVIYLLLVVIILSIVLSAFLSRLITKPIMEITRKAKKMGKGDLTVKFESSDIAEIDDLSNTLNYALTEMIKTDDYRRDLMANVGHDLKTPLTLIKSYAEMVRDITYKDDEKRTEHLNVIINESDRLNALVNDIISLSKLEANAETLNIEKYDLVAAIKEIIQKFEILELTENYNFIYTGPNSAIVSADRSKINQVIYNLINNAINYCGDDSTVYINVSKIKAGYQVEIIDTGKGIDEESIKHVWDRYYKTEKKHKRNKVGTGLGLSIVREILEAHGFIYGVKSTVGKGTNFYFVVKTKK